MDWRRAGGAPAAVCSQAGAKHGNVGVMDSLPGESGHGPWQGLTTTLKSLCFLSFAWTTQLAPEL